MSKIVDVDKGEIVGRWICDACGGATVVRTRSRFVCAPEDPAERCSCSFCCFSMSDRAGTMRWVPALTVVKDG